MSEDSKTKRPSSQHTVARTPQRTVEFVKEDPTPVDMPLPALIERRTKQTQGQVDATYSAVSLLRNEVATLDRKVEIYVDNDAREHAQLRTKFEQLDEQYARLDSKVGELAVSTATANGKLDILVDAVKAQQQVMVHREKVVIEREATEERVRIEDAADEKKYKRQKLLKLFGILAAVAGALSAVAAGLLN